MNPFLPEDMQPPSPFYYLVRHCFRVGWELVKKPKPCYIGDRVHITTRQGIYTVVNVGMKYFTTKTKHGKEVKHEWLEFKSLAGGYWNMKS